MRDPDGADKLSSEKIRMKSYFLWPEHREQYAKYLFGASICAADIEATLETFFPEAVPVLFSSARAGLSAALQLLNISRPDIVWCPPYSSHCVLESIARFATPSTTDIFNAKVALIYHQWGFVHRHELQSDVTVIEDAVDTFFLPKTNPFASNGRFVLWSLPKVIATTWGGVVFCRNDEDAKILRAIRAERSELQRFQALLRMVSDRSVIAGKYWHGSESMNGGLPDFALRQIQASLLYLPAIAQHRECLLDIVRSKKIGFQMDKGRLPSNIPIKLSLGVEKWWGPACVFSAGLRSMNMAHDFSKNAWSKVAPLPVHQDMSESVLNVLLLDQFEGA